MSAAKVAGYAEVSQYFSLLNNRALPRFGKKRFKGGKRKAGRVS